MGRLFMLRMILFFISVLASAVFCQIDVQPDVAFGEENDRFDVTGMNPFQEFHYNYEDPETRRSAGEVSERRTSHPPSPDRSSRDRDRASRTRDRDRHRKSRRSDSSQSGPPLFWHQARRDDYLDDIMELADPRGAENDDLDSYGTQESRRQRQLLDQMRNKEQAEDNAPAQTGRARDLTMYYPLPLHISVQDLVNGTYITGIKIL